VEKVHRDCFRAARYQDRGGPKMFGRCPRYILARCHREIFCARDEISGQGQSRKGKSGLSYYHATSF
jgi:hypothetical protein